MGFVGVLQERDLAPNEMRGVQVDGKKILVANIAGKYYAIGNVCMHMGCSLSDGTLFGENVECPCHGSNYNVKAGSIVKGPTKKPEPAYEVKVEGGRVLVSV
jgi:nitrite reductase/ring-hydroxylating ferredoxin subunit